MSTDQIGGLIDRFGVTGVILIAIGFGLFRVGMWVGPRLDNLLGKHLELVDALQESFKSIKETALGFKDTLLGIVDMLRGLVESNQTVLKNQEDLRREIGEVKDHVRVIRDKN